MKSPVHQIPAPAQVPHGWSKEALFAKSQRYAEQMLEHPHEDWRFGLWSTLVLELLARAALAHVNPAMLADVKDWNNVYHALGFQPKASKFVPRSIDISSVFSRLRETHMGLDPRLENFGSLHMHRRNEELHSGASAFDNVSASTWLPTFYDTCEALLAFINESLSALIGDEHARVAREMIAAANDESAKAVKSTIQAHKTVWSGKTPGEKQKLAAQAAIWSSRHTGHVVECPSCASDAIVDGAAVAPPTMMLKDDQIVERQTFLPSKFECVACNLKMNGLPQLHATGLSDTYTATKTYDAAEYYAARRDEFDGYEPDFNEP